MMANMARRLCRNGSIGDAPGASPCFETAHTLFCELCPWAVSLAVLYYCAATVAAVIQAGGASMLSSVSKMLEKVGEGVAMAVSKASGDLSLTELEEKVNGSSCNS